MIAEAEKLVDEEKLRAQILQSLKRRADMKDLTLSLCKQTGWDWNKSATFIQSIQATHGPEIELLWAKIFSIAGIVCMAIGTIAIFYLFEMYIGWNYVFICLQNSLSGAQMAGGQIPQLSNCMAVTFFGLLGAIANNGGYIAIILLVGGLAGFSLAQRQLKSALGGK